MGGHVFIGIKKRNGELYMARRWTNPTSWWFNNPELYDPDEKLLDQYINLAEEPHPEVEIHPSEYGVILYDAQKGRLLSRQDYSSIGQALVTFSDDEMMEIAQALNQRGLVTGLYVDPIREGVSSWGSEKVENNWVVATPDKIPTFFELVEKALVNGRSHDLGDDYRTMFLVEWKADGLEIDDQKGARGHHHWPDVLKWLGEVGWTAPVWSQEQVEQVYHEAK